MFPLEVCEPGDFRRNRTTKNLWFGVVTILDSIKNHFMMEVRISRILAPAYGYQPHHNRFTTNELIKRYRWIRYVRFGGYVGYPGGYVLFNVADLTHTLQICRIHNLI